MRSTLYELPVVLAVLAFTSECNKTEENGEKPPVQITQASSVSECGGFESEHGAKAAAADGGYCSAEVLQWQYEASTETLVLLDGRIPLNCCGERNIEIEEQEGAYIVTETDAPDEEKGRCHCSCVFDFRLEVKGIPSGSIDLKIVRETTDDEKDPETVFDGAIDLSKGSGSSTIDETDLGPECRQEGATTPLTQIASISECGGFGSGGEGDVDAAADYCDAEVLEWEYEAATRTLRLADNRVLLNCCGEHGMDVIEEDGVYVITETDAPEGEGGRCSCECVFDFKLDVREIPEGVIQVKFLRHVTDMDAEPQVIHEGSLDLSLGSGSVVFDETEVPDCRDSGAIRSQRAFLSECGGAGRGAAGEDEAPYCDAERLVWKYDEATETLTLIDNRILLNCCGAHDMVIEKQGGVYVVTETDAPEEGGSRCRCVCVFDFGIEAVGISSGVISLRLIRDVTDDEEDPKVVFEDDIDLAAGEGSVVLDETDIGGSCAEPEEPFSQNPRISACGGFGRGAEDPENSYCDAEVLQWQYEAGTQTLSLSDNRILLNCCGERGIAIEKQDGIYVVTETDAPEGEGGRCFCECVFDFALDVAGIPAGVISLRIVRDVADDAEDPKVVFEGDIDLTTSEGSVVLDETDIGEICTEPAGPLAQTPRLSACGGFGRGAEAPADPYCDAEVLQWQYDADIHALDLSDNRILLNCCGDHGIFIEEQDGAYVVTETDAPVEAGARCGCMCVFDFAVEAQGIPQAVIQLRLLRHVTDQDAEPTLIFEGSLDLLQGAGSVVLDETDAGPWCGQE